MQNTEINCRICHNPLSAFMSFGNMPIANGFLNPEQFSQEYFFELAPAVCPKCKMFQLIAQPEANKMFHDNYAFFSQTSTGMIKHFKNLADFIKDNYLIHKAEPFIIELGSNDGILLQHFAKNNIKHLGVEPSSNVASVAIKNGINTVCKFFNLATAKQILEQHGQADIINASNVMCHIADFNSVLSGVKELLKPDGVLIFEDPYLGDVIKKTSFDQIYDEHVFLFSVNSIINAISPFDLELIDAIWQPTHGGSMRYVIAKAEKYPINLRVKKQLAIEHNLRLNSSDTYTKFKQKCEQIKYSLFNLLTSLARQNKRVIGYAATSKSATVINYCGLNTKHMQYIVDTTPLKHNKFSPGAHIPIKPYENFKANYPDFAVLLAWNHSQEILDKEQEFAKTGGKWILFVPEVMIKEQVLV